MYRQTIVCPSVCPFLPRSVFLCQSFSQSTMYLACVHPPLTLSRLGREDGCAQATMYPHQSYDSVLDTVLSVNMDWASSGNTNRYGF